MKNSNKLYWKTVGMMELGCAAITASFVLLATIMYLVFEYLPDGYLKVVVFFFGFLICCIPIPVMISVMLLAPFFCSVYYWKKSPGSDSYKEYLNWRMELGRFFFRRGNPVTLSYTLAKLVARTVRIAVGATAAARDFRQDPPKGG